MDFNSPCFVTPHTILGIWKFHEYISEDDTIVGYPSPYGTGAYIKSCSDNFAINNSLSAEKQEGAWQFIRRFADEEYQTANYPRYDDRDTNYSYYCEEGGIPI